MRPPWYMAQIIWGEFDYFSGSGIRPALAYKTGVSWTENEWMDEWIIKWISEWMHSPTVCVSLTLTADSALDSLVLLNELLPFPEKQSPSVVKISRLLVVSHIWFFLSFCIPMVPCFLSHFNWEECHITFSQWNLIINSVLDIQGKALNCWWLVLHCPFPTAPVIVWWSR